MSKKEKTKKSTLTIKEDIMKPFYFVKDERQFVLMQEKNNLPLGYYTKLASAVNAVSERLVVSKNSGSKLTLRNYVNEYTKTVETLLKTITI